jgi:hypothetical protein
MAELRIGAVKARQHDRAARVPSRGAHKLPAKKVAND